MKVSLYFETSVTDVIHIVPLLLLFGKKFIFLLTLHELFLFAHAFLYKSETHHEVGAS